MTDLPKAVYALRAQTSSLAQACLAEDRLEAFQELNRLIVDLTRLGQRLADGNSLPTGDHQVTEVRDKDASNLPEHQLPIFRRYKGQRYQAVLDRDRIGPHGRGKCILIDGNWLSASDSAQKITKTPVNGWVNFWRYLIRPGIERPIDDIRRAAQEAKL